MGENVIQITDAPVQSDEEAYASVGRQMRAEADQAAEGQSRLAASRVAGGRLSPERAASVLEIAKTRGVSPAEVAGNYDTYQAADEERMTYDALAGRPVLSEYTLDSEAHAAIVRRDLPTLAAMADGLKLGMLDLGTALLANKQGKAGLNPDEDSALSEAERLSAEPIQTATTLPRKVAAEIARATPTLALFGSAVASGAGIGMVLGGPGGAAIGGTAAALGTAFTIGWGPLYRRLRGLTQEDGVTPLLDEEQAKAWATAGAGVGAVAQVGIGAPFFKALPGVSGALQKVGLDAAARAASTSVGAAAVRQLAGYGGHVLSGGLAMAGQSAVNAAAVEWAKQQNGADPDWGAVTDAAAEGFKTGLLLAPLAAFEPVRQFFEDRGRIQTARLEAARLDALAAASKDLGIIRTAPAEAEKLLGASAAGTDAQTVYVSPEALTPEVRQAVADIAGPEAMAEAQATGGAVAVPTEKYLVRLADQHEALQQDVKLSPDGMTPREAEEWQKAWHGTPHQFARFDLAKIGTGEGSQSVGYGLYFAQEKTVAEGYRDGYGQVSVNGKPLGSSFAHRSANDSISSAVRKGMSIADAIAHAAEMERKGIEEARTRKATEPWVVKEIARSKKALAFIESLKPEEVTVDPGNLYRVEIPHSDMLLDADRPLAEQSQSVRDAVTNALVDHDFALKDPDEFLRGTTGQMAYDALSDALGGDKAASEALREAGIPGLQYLDGGSRDAGKGTHNFVIWDTSKVRMAPVAPPAPLPPPAKVFREIASARVESMRLGDIHPGRYEQDARRAADRLQEQTKRAAELAAKPGQEVNASARMVEVPQFEGQRDFARAMTKAAKEAHAEAEGNRKFLLGFTKDDARAELGKAGADHLGQVDRLLAGFELGQGASRTEVVRRQATMAWIASEQAAGREPIIPDSVLAKLDRFVHWKELTPGELRDLRSAVESIAHQAKLKNTILEKQARVDRGRGIDQLVTGLRDNTEEKPFRPRGTVQERLAKVFESLNGLKYGIRAVERIVNVLDGEDINGPWHRYVWDPIDEGTQRWHDLTRKTTDVITKVMSEVPADMKKRWSETRFRAAGQQWNMEAAIAVALNSGNESNARKMLEGWQHESVAGRGLQQWTQDTPEEFLRHLTREDWKVVQSIWDGLESMWPESAALEKRMVGVPPEKVEPRPFTRTLEDGSKVDLQGGYYPVIYDPDFSRQGAAAEEPTSIKLFDSNYHRAATPQGRLQKRIEGFARPVTLSIDNLPGRISESAKDVAMREALISVHSVLTDDKVRAALHTSELGRAGEKALLGWLRDTANDLVVPDNGSNTWLNMQTRSRAGYSASIFAYSLSQTAQNLTGILPATRKVGPKWMADAMLRFRKDRSALTEWIDSQSGEMRNEDKGGQILSEALQEASKGTGLGTRFLKFGLNFWRATDQAVKYPTWLADYMRSTALDADGGRGMSHEDAVKHANQTVRLDVMANNTKDLPALLRNRIGRWMLPLYSYSMHRLNMFGDAVGGAQKAIKEHKYGTAAAVIGGVWGTMAAEQIASELVKGNGPKDENDDGEVSGIDWAIWSAKIAVLAPPSMIPFVGNSVKAAASGRDAMSAPEVALTVGVGRTVRDVYHAAAAKLAGEDIDDEMARRLAIKLVETGGYVTAAVTGKPIPVSQIRATAGYLLDENSPKDTPLQVGLGVVGGKKRPGKLLSLTE